MSDEPAGHWYSSGRLWALAAVLGLLVVVAAAAAVLSFDAIRELAIACGFAPSLAWLLPIAIDAGAAAGVIVWLVRIFPDDARSFAAIFAAVMLGVSVVANFLSHWFAADHIQPPWWVIGLVSTVAPATLWVIVHLAVLTFRPAVRAHEQPAPEAARARVRIVPAPGAVSLAKDDGDDAEWLNADAGNGDGYSAAVRRDAAALGVPLEPAPPGEDKKARRARLHRVRSRVDRARERKDRGDPDDDREWTTVGAEARGD